MKKIIIYHLALLLFITQSFAQKYVNIDPVAAAKDPHFFFYIDDHGRQLITRPEIVETSFSDMFTPDPNYLIYNNLGQYIGHTEWLSVRGTDGNNWKTKIHASYENGPGTVRIWIESDLLNGGAENGALGIVDWNLRKQVLTVSGRILRGQRPFFTKTDTGAYGSVTASTPPVLTTPAVKERNQGGMGGEH